jgi:Protein of unknown function (DUF2797)
MQTVWTGTLRKMRSQADDPVSYFLTDGWWEPENRVADHGLNQYLGRELMIRFGGEINCTACGRKTKKTFNQGFCFPCAQSRAEADICIVKPELCHHGDANNPCRDEHFAQTQCFQPHILYCSLTSGVKVGITRQPNVPSRWIDQGATAAIPLARVADRRTVGLVEKSLVEEGFQDKTHWTRMLKGETGDSDLAATAERILDRLEEWNVDGVLPEAERVEHRFRFPVDVWPEKVKSFNLDKEPEAGGVLQGIKGQYLIFAGGVINLRKFTGYRVEVAVSAS